LIYRRPVYFAGVRFGSPTPLSVSNLYWKTGKEKKLADGRVKERAGEESNHKTARKPGSSILSDINSQKKNSFLINLHPVQAISRSLSFSRLKLSMIGKPSRSSRRTHQVKTV
jgi:hypothetical protein